MISSINKLIKKLTSNTAVMAIAAVFVIYALYNYSSNKSMILSNMENAHQHNTGESSVDGGASNYQPAEPEGDNEEYGQADGMGTDTYGLPPSCAKQEVVNPSELLPRDDNSDFSKLNPQGAGDLQNVSLLKAGHHIGINTVGQSLRNANLQLRSEPPNPKMETGPWNGSTITGDPYRRPLEIGSN